VIDAGRLFDSERIAAGYASARPAVHRQLVTHLAAHLDRHWPVAVALDVGCGAGGSTAALAPLARRRLGIDPFLVMVAAARSAAAGAELFSVGTAEQLPVRDGSIDLIGAAGSLNFADLDAFAVEAARVAAPEGLLVVTDYRLGIPAGATAWAEEFPRRWPRPPARAVSAASFAGTPWSVVMDDTVDVRLAMSLTRYVDYLVTDTGVESAVRSGETTEVEVRAACAAALGDTFRGEVLVTFPASVIALRREGQSNFTAE